MVCYVCVWFCYVCEMVLLPVWDVLLRVSHVFVTCLEWFLLRVLDDFVTFVGWIRYVCGMDLLRELDGFVTSLGWIC